MAALFGRTNSKPAQGRSGAAPGSWRHLRAEYPVGAALLAIYIVAAVLALLPAHVATTAHETTVFVLFLALSAVAALVCSGAERLRHISTGGMVLDSVDVWVFAGALVLPSHYMLGLVVWGYLLAAKAWRGRQVWKWIASVATLAIAGGVAVHILASSTPRPVAVLTAVVVFEITQAAMTALLMVTTGVTGVSEEMFGSSRAWVASFTNLALGVVLAELSRWELWAVVAFVPCVIVVQILLSRLQQRGPASTTDPQTGALREGVWRHYASSQLPDPSWSLLTIDVLTGGSAAPVCAAGVVLDRLQQGERIGRWGSGFVALVNVGGDSAAAVARAIEDEVLTAVGVEIAVGWSSAKGTLESQLVEAEARLVARSDEELTRLIHQPAGRRVAPSPRSRLG